MEVEDHFDINVPDEASERIDTVGQIADGVLELLGQARAGPILVGFVSDDQWFINVRGDMESNALKCGDGIKTIRIFGNNGRDLMRVFGNGRIPLRLYHSDQDGNENNG